MCFESGWAGWEAVGVWVEAIALIAIFGLDWIERRDSRKERQEQRRAREEERQERAELRAERQRLEADRQRNDVITATALGSLALRLRVGLGRLDPMNPNDSQLRAFAQLGEQDVADLQNLARHVNARAITSASEAAAHLRVIYEMVQAVKRINEGIGWNPAAPEKARWKEAVEGAHRALQEVEAACNQVVAT